MMERSKRSASGGIDFSWSASRGDEPPPPPSRDQTEWIGSTKPSVGATLAPSSSSHHLTIPTSSIHPFIRPAIYPANNLFFTTTVIMEAYLQSLKVTDLKQLLKAASLPTTGVKQTFVERLLENPEALPKDIPAAGEAPPPAAAAAAGSPDAKAVSPSAATAAAAAKSPVAKPAGAASAGSPGKATSATAASPAPTATTPAVDASTAPVPAGPSAAERHASLLAELEKRRARAARFGQDDAVKDAEAKLERAKKFGAAEGSEALDVLERELGMRPAAKKAAPAASAAGAGKKEKDGKPAAAAAKPAKAPEPELSEEAKAELAKRKEQEEEAKRRRAERFGLVDKEAEEKKRKREERFAGGAAAGAGADGEGKAGSPPSEKKVKA